MRTNGIQALCEHCARYALARYYVDLPERLAESVNKCRPNVIGITAWLDTNHHEEYIVQRTLFRLGVK